ncbi:putative HMG box protein, partial [Cyathus striatus]
PRPSNAFILYRRAMVKQVKAKHGEKPLGEISKIIGKMWKAETPEFRKKYAIMAEEEKAEHKVKYPGYRYQPR